MPKKPISETLSISTSKNKMKEIKIEKFYAGSDKDLQIILQAITDKGGRIISVEHFIDERHRVIYEI